MIRSGILNPQLMHLFLRFRHTNTLVIADRGFPFWPMIETVDLSLVDGVPTVLQVLAAIRAEFDVEKIYMAQEFTHENTPQTQALFRAVAKETPVVYEAHVDFKKRVPHALGLVRTGDTIQYANMILVSGRI
ncbi:MAG: D-ribose pyranase [Chloroflexi bacterium]|nr:D-ribose pyranase [Chloroflexota bacterium]